MEDPSKVARVADRTIRVREVVDHDAELIKVVQDIDLLTFSEPTWSRYTMGLMLRHGRTFLLEMEGVVIGTCQVIRSFDRPGEAALFSMAIRPGYRNQGLGTCFLRGVIDRIRAAGFRSVVLEVDPGNLAAMHVYRTKFGFHEVGLLRGEYGPGHDRMQMRLVLEDRLGEVTKLPV